MIISIQNYSEQYLDDVVELVKKFYDEAVGEYDHMLDLDTLIATIKTQAETNANNAFLLLVDNKCQGILYGQQFQSMSTGKLVFQELIWYMNIAFRRYGIKLLKHAEKVLHDNGVSSIIMAVLENSKTEKLKQFYSRMGYRPMETHFIRQL